MQTTRKHYRLISFVSLLILFLLFQVSAAQDQDENLVKINQLYQNYQQSFPKVVEIEVAKAISLLADNDVVFVDTRSKKEMKVSSIPGAITVKAFNKQKERYKQKRIIAFCTIGYRSGKFAQKMGRKGYRVENLKNGLLGWVYGGGPLVVDGKETKTLHVYGKKWNLVPEGYTGYW